MERENGCFPVPVRAWEYSVFDLAKQLRSAVVPFRVNPLILHTPQFPPTLPDRAIFHTACMHVLVDQDSYFPKGVSFLLFWTSAEKDNEVWVQHNLSDTVRPSTYILYNYLL